jgi:UPF0176 protein
MLHIAFYRFAALSDAWGVARVVRAMASRLQGSVIVAKTGINGTLAGSTDDLDAFERELQSHPDLNGVFSGMRFQRTDCQRAPFGKLKISVKPDLVQMGLPQALLETATGKGTSHLLNADQWDELISADDVVLIDNRNRFEFALGHFDQALDPAVDFFADFAQFLERELPNIQAGSKKIAMYCTGGIRCEKTGAWLAEQGISSYQLDGGILNYLRERRQSALPRSALVEISASLSDGDSAESNRRGLWQGNCFVFDNRNALNAKLEPIDLEPEDIYPEASDAWRLQRAKRLMDATDD